MLHTIEELIQRLDVMKDKAIELHRIRNQYSELSGKTYDKTIRGEYMGGLDEPLPRQVMFPEFHKTLRKEGRHTKEDYYNFERRGPVQRLDQEWLDGVMQYYDDLQAGKFD